MTCDTLAAQRADFAARAASFPMLPEPRVILHEERVLTGQISPVSKGGERVLAGRDGQSNTASGARQSRSASSVHGSSFVGSRNTR